MHKHTHTLMLQHLGFSSKAGFCSPRLHQTLMDRCLKAGFLTYLPFPSQRCMSSIHYKISSLQTLHSYTADVFHSCSAELERSIIRLCGYFFLTFFFNSYMICRTQSGWQSLSPTFLGHNGLLFQSKCVCNINKKGSISSLVKHYPAGPVLPIQVLVFLSIILTANRLYILNDDLRSMKSLHCRQ